MNALVILFAAFSLVAVHLFRAPAGGKRTAAIAAFVIGLLITAAGVRMGASAAGLGFTTGFDRVVNSAAASAEAAGDNPLIVFTGASYSRNAVDDLRLTERLQAAGYPHTVINLSLEAASLPEREINLLAFLNRIDRTPDLVFVEVAKTFDDRPAQFFNNSKFSARGIEQFNGRTSVWTLLGLVDGGCGGFTDCGKSIALTSAHFGLNALNVGLVARGENPKEAYDMSAYDPAFEPRDIVLEHDRLAGLRAGPDFVPSHGPKWVSSLRGLLERRLESDGVREVGYYLPPVIDANARAYLDGLCLGEFAGDPCLAPSDPRLLAALEGEVWYDDSHLLAGGADIYTDWLADQLITSGVLGAPRGRVFADEGVPAP